MHELIRERLEPHAGAIVDNLIKIAKDGTRAIVVDHEIARVEDYDIQMRATNMLLDRTDGKPVQMIAEGQDPNVEAELAAMDSESLRRLAHRSRQQAQVTSGLEEIVDAEVVDA